MFIWKTLLAGSLTCTTVATASLVAPKPPPAPANFVDVENGEGISRTLTMARSFDATNPFFQPLGTNGRTCATCHPVDQGMLDILDFYDSRFSIGLNTQEEADLKAFLVTL